jgi:hypothetical protein
MAVSHWSLRDIAQAAIITALQISTLITSEKEKKAVSFSSNHKLSDC